MVTRYGPDNIHPRARPYGSLHLSGHHVQSWQRLHSDPSPLQETHEKEPKANWRLQGTGTYEAWILYFVQCVNAKDFEGLGEQWEFSVFPGVVGGEVSFCQWSALPLKKARDKRSIGKSDDVDGLN